MDMTRRGFLKLFGCAVAAVSVPAVAAGGRFRIYKIEKKYSPGEYFYVKIPDDGPAEVVDPTDDYLNTLEWDGSDGALAERRDLFADIVEGSLRPEDRAGFAARMDGLFSVLIACGSCEENAGVLSGLADLFEDRPVRLAFLDQILNGCAGFAKWRTWYKRAFAEATGKPDGDARDRIIRTAENPYRIGKETADRIVSYIGNRPGHWLNPAGANDVPPDAR